MRIETKTADSNGIIQGINGGVRFAAVPAYGAGYEVATFETDGNLGTTQEYEPGRVLTLPQWGVAKLKDVPPGSSWRIFVAETLSQYIGDLERSPVVLMDVEVAGVVNDGEYGIVNARARPAACQSVAPAVLAAYALGTGVLFDVRSFRAVKLAARTNNGIVDYDDEVVSVYLDGFDDRDAYRASAIACGSGNNLGAATAQDGSILAGLGVTDAVETLRRRTGERFQYVRPRVRFDAGPLEFDGGLRLTLVGYP